MQEQLNRLESMLADLVSMQGKVLVKLDALETRMDAVENRLSAVENRLDTVEKNLNGFRIETQINFQQLEKRLDSRLRLTEADLDKTMSEVEKLKVANN